MMPFDTFLTFTQPATGGLNVGGQITGAGESADQAHRNAIELRSFTFGVENPTTIGSATGGAGAGKAKFSLLTIQKNIDQASTNLFQATTTGAHFPEAKLFVRKAGTGRDYLTYTFRMVFVTRVKWDGGEGDESPVETVDLVYGAMQVEYLRTDASGAPVGQPARGLWSQVSNQPTIDVPGN
jgi:type VI secretion system secreted protein Hcp